MLIMRGRFRNNGQSPAFKFKAEPKLSVNIAFYDASRNELPSLVAKEEGFTSWWSSTRLSFADITHIYNGGTQWAAHMTSTWTDVFGKTNVVAASLSHTGGLSEPDSKGFRTGEMRVTYTTAEFGKEPTQLS